MYRPSRERIEECADALVSQIFEIEPSPPAGCNPARLVELDERVFEVYKNRVAKVCIMDLYPLVLGSYILLVHYFCCLRERNLSATEVHLGILDEVYQEATAVLAIPFEQRMPEEIAEGTSAGPVYNAGYRLCLEVLQAYAKA